MMLMFHSYILAIMENSTCAVEVLYLFHCIVGVCVCGTFRSSLQYVAFDGWSRQDLHVYMYSTCFLLSFAPFMSK